MVKVRIWHDEWYPVTTYDREFIEGNKSVVDVPDDVIAAYDAARTKFLDTEAALEKYYATLDGE